MTIKIREWQEIMDPICGDRAATRWSKTRIQKVLESTNRNYGPVQAVCADRQFDSPLNWNLLTQEKIINAICPPIWAGHVFLRAKWLG